MGLYVAGHIRGKPGGLYQRAKMLMHHALKMLGRRTSLTKVR